jgi:hypothetical protein
VAAEGLARAERQALSLSAVVRYYVRGLHDLFAPNVLLVAAFPFFLVLLLFAAEAWAALIWLIPWLRGLLPPVESSFASRIIDIFLGLGLAGILAIANILTAVTLIGVFLTERLVGYVNRMYYHRQVAPFAGNLLIVATSVKSFCKFLTLFLLLFPFYFVPIVNVIAFALPSYFYFRSSVLFDVGSQTVSRPAYETLLVRYRRGLHLLILPAFLLSYLPILGMFSYIYAFLVVAHFFLDREDRNFRV